MFTLINPHFLANVKFSSWINFISFTFKFHKLKIKMFLLEYKMKLKSLFRKLKVSIKNDKKIETSIKFEFNKLNISDESLNSVITNHENCNQPYTTKKVWCKECVPSCIIEGWTSGNSEVDDFIKDTIYNSKYYNGFP